MLTTQEVVINMIFDLTKHMPPMLAGEELLRAMTILPEYDASVNSKPASDRLIELSNLYQLYIRQIVL